MNLYFARKINRNLLRVCWFLGWSLSIAWAMADQGPMGPQESLKMIQMQPNFEIELVASEPQVVDPVSMSIDERGRMWVVEMRDYPVEDDTPKSRIVVLEDVDRDGVFETSRVFAEKLRYATGVMPWKDGALVTAHGQLLNLQDSDGDGVADRTTVWLDGFSIGNPQLRANHPMMGPDGWLYIASGLRGGKVFSKLPWGESPSSSVDLTGSDLKLNLLTGRLEPISGPSQFGLSFDRLGHRYGVSNRQPCFEIVSERADLGLSPLSGLSNATSEVSPGEAASKVFPLVKAWTTSNLHAGQFTAACGMIVSHSPHFGAEPFATVLTCEPTGGLVQRRAIERRNGRSKVADEPSTTEWLASRDPWFRPVDLYEGPGGDIYVVDMYRAVIEHPEWVPPELKKRPDERFGDTHGRIYRVTSKSRKRMVESMSSSRNDLEWLESPFAWNRSIATRKLMEAMQSENRQSVIHAMRNLAGSSAQRRGDAPVANLAILLANLDALDEPLVRSMLASTDSQQRSLAWNCLRQSSQSWNHTWRDAFLKTLSNSQSEVDEILNAAWYMAKQSKQLGVATNEQRSLSTQIVDAIADLWLAHSQDLHVAMALSAACKEELDDLLTALTRRQVELESAVQSKNARSALLRLAGYVATHFAPEKVQSLVANLVTQSQSQSSHHLGTTLVLEGIVKSGKVPVLSGSPLEAFLLQGIAPAQDLDVRQSCIAMLGYCKSSEARNAALALLNASDSKLLKPAISACSEHDTSEFNLWLLDRLPTALPEIRQDVFAAIRSRPTRVSALLDRFETGVASPKILDAAQIQSLKSIKDEVLTPRISKFLASSVNANRQKVVEDYAKKIRDIPVDPKQNRGKALFVKNCASCHKLDDVGSVVGPDISDSRVQTYDNLLIAVLDPNRSIDANYFRYLAMTKDGRTIEGILKDSNAQTVTLQNQNGSFVVERSEIEEFKSSGVSLMPEGIESQLPADELAELLWYIKNWRYAVENVPANATIAR